jgi:hypothetical protein
MAAGAWGLLSEADTTRPADAARFVLGLAVAHDVLVAPLAVLIGWAVARSVPPRARAPVQASLVASAFVIVFAFPFVRGYGRVVTNPSILPRDYGRGTVAVVTAVWTVAAVVILAQRRRRRRAARARRP